MISKRVFLAAALLAVCGLVASVNAASIEVIPTVQAVEFSPGNPALWTPNGNGADIEPGQGEVFATIGFSFQISDVGTPAAMGFGNVNFDVVRTGDIVDPRFGWQASMGTIDHDGNAFTAPVAIFADNGDLGADGLDLIDIVVGVAPLSFVANDARGLLGQNEPLHMGSVIFTVDTDAGGGGTVDASLKAFSTFNDQNVLGRNDGAMVGGSAALNVIPEPTSCVLLGISSLLMLVVRRKRS